MSMTRARKRTSASNEFMRWLDKRLAKQNWSDYRLAAESDLHTSTISRVRGGAVVGFEVYAKIGRALNVPAETLCRLAGLLPKEPQTTPERDEWNALFDQLPAAEREKVLKLVNVFIEEKHKSRLPKRKRGGGQQ